MKVLNIFLSILILLLAAASAVFSYFLYEKRTQLVDGWEKMAQAVNKSAANLDAGSGTEVAKALAPEELGHDKYDNLDEKLPKLSEHANNIITERDDMAKALRNIAETVEMDNVKGLDDFKALKTYKENSNAVIEKVKYCIEQQNNILQKVCESARKVNVDLTLSALKGANYNSEMNKFNSKVNFINSRIRDADSKFKTILSVTGSTAKLDFSSAGYRGSTAKVLNAVRELNNKYNQSKGALKSEGSKIVQLQNTVKGKDGRIDGLNQLIKKRDMEIKRLRIIISGPGGSEVIDSPWENGSKEARRAVQGKIIKVDRKYGFVVIDLGSGTSIKQKIGTKENYANPMIPVNAKMIVARNIESTNGKYIGEIKIIKVHEDCSIANVISTVKGQSVATGDTVFFSDSQINAITK